MEQTIVRVFPKTSGSVCSLFSLDVGSQSEENNRPQDDADSSDSNSCKICRDTSIRDEIISPCHCAGTMGRVHRKCLEEWLSTTNKSSCEICRCDFLVHRTPKTFKDWLSDRQSRIERKYIGADFGCFLILTPLVVASTYLCGKGAYYYFGIGLVWLSAGLIMLSSFLWLIYVFWIVVTYRFHKKMWNEWQRHHQDVHLLSNDEHIGLDNSALVTIETDTNVV